MEQYAGLRERRRGADRQRVQGVDTATASGVSHVGDLRWGWTVGGGVEYGFAPNWSAAVEYNYVDTGAKDEGVPSDNVFDRITQRIHMATLRVNYRFAPWR